MAFITHQTWGAMAALAALRSPAMLHLCESDATAARQAVATGICGDLWENDGFMGRNPWISWEISWEILQE